MENWTLIPPGEDLRLECKRCTRQVFFATLSKAGVRFWCYECSAEICHIDERGQVEWGEGQNDANALDADAS